MEDLSGKIEVDLPEQVGPEAVVAIEKASVAGLSEKVPGDDLARLLTRGGLPPVMLSRKSGVRQPGRASQSYRSTWPLNEVTLLLRDEYQRQPQLPLGQRVAFIGAAGAGKTTALCKRLAVDALVRRRRAAVLKVDLDRANPSDGLAVFCEALGVPLSRAVEDLPALFPNGKIYIDLPGIGLGDTKEIAHYSEALDNLSVISRVLSSTPPTKPMSSSNSATRASDSPPPMWSLTQSR